MNDDPAVVALIAEIREALELIERLAAHAERMGQDDAAELFRTAELSRRRLEREHVVIAVVGEKKSGKSTFLNAILGDPLLGTAVRECTGTITELERSEEPDWEAQLEHGADLHFSPAFRARRADLERELAEATAELGAEGNAFVDALRGELLENERELRGRFAADVRALTDMQATSGEVALLRIRWPARRLPADVVLMDTPGVNTDDARNVERAWRAIEVYADGCLLLSDMQQAMSASTLGFLEKLRDVVPHVALVLTKVDRAIENALAVGGEPAEEVAEARRVAERRFAEQSGRDPAEILSFAVAAEPALRGEQVEMVRAFEAELERLFAVLRQERSLVVASRAVAAFRRAQRALEQAGARAQGAYAEHIALLEAQRIPAPEDFFSAEMARLEPSIERRAAMLVDAMVRAVPSALLEVDAELVGLIRVAPSRQALQELSGELDAVARRALEGALREMQRGAGRLLDQSLNALIPQAMASLRERYSIVEEHRSAQYTASLPDLRDIAGTLKIELSALSEVRGEAPIRWGSELVDAIVGIPRGVPPQWGAVFARGFSGLNAFFSPLERDKKAMMEEVTGALDASRADLETQLRGATGRVARALRTQVEHALREATGRFSTWISGVIEAEARHIGDEQDQLAELNEVIAELRRREQSLRERMEEVAKRSRAL